MGIQTVKNSTSWYRWITAFIMGGILLHAGISIAQSEAPSAPSSPLSLPPKVESPSKTDAAVNMTANVDNSAQEEVGTVSASERELALRAEIARLEAVKARAEADKAQAEADKAQAASEAKTLAEGTPTAVPSASEATEDDASKDEQPNHKGFYGRFTPGIGFGSIWGVGTMDPLPGIERITDPAHQSVTGSLGGDLGAGIVKNLALHVGAFFEKMILRDQTNAYMAFNLFGLDAGLSWYFTKHELFLTGQFRWVRMLVKFPTVSCSEYFTDTFDWYRGPGASLTFGREWYDNAEDQGAVGVGLQANYYQLHGGLNDDYTFHYFSLLIVMTFTRF